MASFLDSLKVYAAPFSVTNKEAVPAEAKAKILKAEVVKSEYGLSAKFTLKAGGVSYMPLSRDASLFIGDIIDLDKAIIITLTRGDETIQRLENV